MSGVKRTTTTIDVNELSSLRAQASRAVSIESQNAILNSQNAALIQANADMSRRMQMLEAHNQNNTRAMESMRSETRRAIAQAMKESEAAVRAAKQEASRAIAQAAKESEAAVRAVRQDVRRTAAENARAIQETSRRMEEDLRRTEARLGRQMQNQNRRIDAIRNGVDLINAGNAALAEQAQDLLAAAVAIAANANDFPHGEEMIGGTRPLQSALHRAQEAIDLTGKQPVNAPVARQNAADAFEQAQDFYQRAAAAEELWNLHQLAARQSIEAAAARLESTRTLRIEESDESGKPICLEIDVDHWSDGELTALDSRIAALRSGLDSSRTIEDLDGVRAAADRVSEEIVNAAGSANIAAFESQNRSEAACDFADNLADHGMELIEQGFDSGDKRGAHRIRMRDAVTGDEVIISQIPSRNADGSITTRVEADLVSNTLSGETFERRGQEMYQTLGLAADDRHTQTGVETLPGYETRPSNRGITVTAAPRAEPASDRGDIEARPAY